MILEFFLIRYHHHSAFLILSTSKETEGKVNTAARVRDFHRLWVWVGGVRVQVDELQPQTNPHLRHGFVRV